MQELFVNFFVKNLLTLPNSKPFMVRRGWNIHFACKCLSSSGLGENTNHFFGKSDKMTLEKTGFALAFCAIFHYNSGKLGSGGVKVGELIAVLSGKGGTGKTSVCAAVASALAMDGKRVLCVDCDVGLRNLDISLGMSDSGALSFMDVCNGQYDLSMASSHPLIPALHFLTAPMNCQVDTIDPVAFDRFVRKARQEFDFVFLDAPAGVETGFRLAAASADRCILVTGPGPPPCGTLHGWANCWSSWARPTSVLWSTGSAPGWFPPWRPPSTT